MTATGRERGAHCVDCDVLCRVVDNFGDAGVAWRLARVLHGTQHWTVRLLIDDVTTLYRLAPEIAPHGHQQLVEGIQIGSIDAPQVDPAPLVVETFGCGLPVGFVAPMQAVPRVWLNLEYLSAEPWVETCHALPSPRPGSGLVRHFFFPGFTAKTGGILREPGLAARRHQFQSEAGAITQWFAAHGVVSSDLRAVRVSLFTYAPGWPEDWFWQLLTRLQQPLHLILAEGVLSDAVRAFCGSAAVGATRTEGPLQVSVMPFLAHDQFDLLLWGCAANLVRGEDSFVRAQLAARPMLWDPYVQEERSHLVKLDAFLARYCHAWPHEQERNYRQVAHALVAREPDWAGQFARWCGQLAALQPRACAWADELFRLPELGSSIAQFARKLLE